MASDRLHKPPQREPPAQHAGQKRKDAPNTLPTGNAKKQKSNDNQRPRGRTDYRAKARDARVLSTQASGKAFRNGELDVSAFVKSREYEIRALEEGMARSKKALNRRAFQQVPKDLRRRTASHNVKRVPKRLRDRSKREMADDNTPTVTARRRKPTRHMRLRLETAKKLRALGSKRKAEKEEAKAEKVTVNDPKAARPMEPTATEPATTGKIKTRAPKLKVAALATPPVPRAKFRKRQIHKSWLPTHLYHAKRARMTAPSAPLWRFSIPLTPTAKSYRPTHRASHDRGAVAWDMSYMSTIGLEGRQDSLEGLLRPFGLTDEELKGKKCQKWRHGTRVLETFACQREAPHGPIAPVTIIWCVPSTEQDLQTVEPSKRKRKLLLRVHPSAFFQLWEEVLRLAKVAKPQISVEDLRFEIGSIEITGPGATEALLGALWPIAGKQTPNDVYKDGPNTATSLDEPVAPRVGDIWGALAGLTNPAMLPTGASLGFSVQDPRLHHPPRTVKVPKSDAEQQRLLEVVANWPIDPSQTPPDLFERKLRLAAGSALPSQKAINRRKSLASPGRYPEPVPQDPQIPVVLYVSSSSASTIPAKSHSPSTSTSWTLLCPWKCVQPIWYSLMYYPLSTGQQPRFGGLNEKRQLAFEAGVPCFPADFPGTKAGWQWEMQERREREDYWRRRPKSKRVSWERVELGGGKKGEVGVGWACDWERLLNGVPDMNMDVEMEDADGGVSLIDIETADGTAQSPKASKTAGEKQEPRKADVPTGKTAKSKKEEPQTIPKAPGLTQLPTAKALALLQSSSTGPPSPIKLSGILLTVRIALLTRGVPQTCARVYRLPSATAQPDLRKQWLALMPSNQPSHKKSKGPKHGSPRLPKDAPTHVVQQRLAQSLLEPPRAGEGEYPACPGEEDLVGFVTTGNFNLGEGQGTGVGSVLLERVMDEVREGGDEARVCIVRNAGNGIGRLARWDVA